MVLTFRCNTHTVPNVRIPPNAETHDAECTENCLEKESSKLLTAIAYRALRNSTGYFTGYMQKTSVRWSFRIEAGDGES